MGIVLLLIVLLAVSSYLIFVTMQDRKIQKAETAAKAGDTDTALSIFMDSLRRDPNNVESLWHLGNINEEQGKFAEAIGYYNRLIELDTESELYTPFELYRRMGILFKRIGHDKEALDNLMQAYQILPTARDVVREVALILFSQDKFYRALNFFEKAVPHFREDQEFMRNYGLCLLMTDSLTDSLNVFEQHERDFPSDFIAKYIQSFVYLKIRAYGRSRQLLEEVVNSEDFVLSKDMMFFAIKMLFLSYASEESYDVARDLQKRLPTMLLDEGSKESAKRDEANMSFIYLRYKQKYYDLAAEKLETLLENINTEGMNEEEAKKYKESKSFLFEKLNILDQYKKETDKLQNTHHKPDASYLILESNAKDAKAELDKLFADWEQKFINVQTLYSFFRINPQIRFDPLPILEKYTSQSVDTMKQTHSTSSVSAAPRAVGNVFKKLGVNLTDVTGSFVNMDFPSFGLLAQELAKKMGYKVINPNLRLDIGASPEGQGVDLLCEEAGNKNVRIIFCLRRWSQPIGFITVQNLLSVLRPNRASRIVMVSTADLSDEAKGVVEKDPKFDFYSAEDVSTYMY